MPCAAHQSLPNNRRRNNSESTHSNSSFRHSSPLLRVTYL
jgi:hypothetical protein